MTVAELCLLAALLLPYLTIAVPKARGGTTFDNANPRDPAFYAAPDRARALAAHQNGFEALPLFVAAILLAELRAVPQGTIDGLALGYIAARIAYVAAYLANRATLRSIVWGIAVLLALGIFLSPWWAR